MEYKGTKGEFIHGGQLFVTTKELKEKRAVLNIFHKNFIKEEYMGNLELVIDAGNTATKTGLLPSTILKQRDEAVEMLKSILEDIEKQIEIEYSSEKHYRIEDLIKSITESK